MDAEADQALSPQSHFSGGYPETLHNTMKIQKSVPIHQGTGDELGRELWLQLKN